MKEIVYYVATSLDGCIATPDGGVDWLSGFEQEGEDYGYGALLESVDLLLMGRATYDFARSVGPWPYGSRRCLVFTRRSVATPPPGVVVTALEPVDALADPRAPSWSRAWLVGGGTLAASFRSAGLIHEYIVSIIPVVLGSGIRLFEGPGALDRLTLVESRPFPSGVVQLRYRTR